MSPFGADAANFASGINEGSTTGNERRREHGLNKKPEEPFTCSVSNCALHKQDIGDNLNLCLLGMHFAFQQSGGLTRLFK